MSEKWFDPFGGFRPLRRGITTIGAGLIGMQLFVLNRTRCEGLDRLRDLPRRRVLFVMNHQTYFMDMMAFFWFIGSPNPFRSTPWIYYVADRTTMKMNPLAQHVLSRNGCIPVSRTWKEGQDLIQRSLNHQDQMAVGAALDDGWVVTFPQGTTKPFAPVRRGTAHMIREHRPIVVPVVHSGVGEAFPKSSIWPKRRGVQMTFRIKAPLEIDYDANVDQICSTIADAIEQSDRYRPGAGVSSDNPSTVYRAEPYRIDPNRPLPYLTTP